LVAGIDMRFNCHSRLRPINATYLSKKREYTKEQKWKKEKKKKESCSNKNQLARSVEKTKLNLYVRNKKTLPYFGHFQ
jgi:hypothetical protein